MIVDVDLERRVGGGEKKREGELLLQARRVFPTCQGAGGSCAVPASRSPPRSQGGSGRAGGPHSVSCTLSPAPSAAVGSCALS